MQREEARQRCIADAVVAANPFHQVRADAGNGAEQVDDDLRAPVRHVAVGQHVAHEGFGHEREIDQHADDPQQLARALVAAVQERACHVQVHDDEEERRADRVHVAAAASHVRHFADAGIRPSSKARRLARLEVHGDEDARHDLHDEHQQRQRAEEIPDVEILRRVVAVSWSAMNWSTGRRLLSQARNPPALFSIVADIRPPLSQRGIDADDELVVAFEAVRRNLEVHRGRRAFEHAAREIELRAVAGAEESARPVRHHRRITRREARLRQASQMRAGADEHQHFGLERARVVLGVFGLLRFLGLRVLELAHRAQSATPAFRACA